MSLGCDAAPARLPVARVGGARPDALPGRLPLMPAALGGNTPSIRVEAEHAVPYGTFREDRS